MHPSECKLFGLLDQYLVGTLSASALVNAVDSLVSEDELIDCPDAVRDAISAFQDELALFVHDESARKESTLYFGDTQLAAKVRDFRSKLEKCKECRRDDGQQNSEHS